MILYSVLMSFVVSASFSNDTSNGGDLKFNTTLPTLPFNCTAISSCKNCVLKKKKSEILEIAELFKSDRIHVVDIGIVFSGNGPYQLLMSDFHVKLLNPIGQEILYALQQRVFKYVTWTLNVGISNSKLDVEESRDDCVDRWKSVADFAFENMQDIVRSLNLTTNYKVWYSFKETSSGKVRQICCTNLSKCNYELCSEDNSLLYRSYVLWYIAAVLMFFGLWCGVVSLLFVFLSRTQFNLKYPEYYKLQESMMSPFSIFFKIIWEECDGKPSFIRSCLSLGIILYFIYLRFGRIEFLNAYILPFFFWGLIFSIPCLFKPKITKSYILEKVKKTRNASSILLLTAKKFVCDSNVLRVERNSNVLRVERNSNVLRVERNSNVLRGGFGFENRSGTIGSEVFVDVIQQLTTPCNLKFWRDILPCDFISRWFRKCGGNRIFKTLMLFLCYVFEMVICSFLVCVAIVLSMAYLIIIFPSLYFMQLLFLAESLKYSFIEFHYALLYLLVAIDLGGLCLSLCYSCFVMTFAIQSFVLGLFLNLTHFIPYFAFSAVLLFYCSSYWKSMEEKYLVLKRLIYEECQGVQDVNNGCIPNRYPKRKEKVLPVVSKVLYDKIREELLPYHTNLFYFGLKIFWSLIFSYSIFKLINVLHEFNVTGAVQVVTTASLGVIPHIFNMVALKTNEEKKKALEEKLKLNVKYMVEDLVRANPELAWTVLILQENGNTATDENVQNVSDNRQENGQNYELLEIRSGSDNDNQQVEEIRQHVSTV